MRFKETNGPVQGHASCQTPESKSLNPSAGLAGMKRGDNLKNMEGWVPKAGLSDRCCLGQAQAGQCGPGMWLWLCVLSLSLPDWAKRPGTPIKTWALPTDEAGGPSIRATEGRPALWKLPTHKAKSPWGHPDSTSQRRARPGHEPGPAAPSLLTPRGDLFTVGPGWRQWFCGLNPTAATQGSCCIHIRHTCACVRVGCVCGVRLGPGNKLPGSWVGTRCVCILGVPGDKHEYTMDCINICCSALSVKVGSDAWGWL